MKKQKFLAFILLFSLMVGGGCKKKPSSLDPSVDHSSAGNEATSKTDATTEEDSLVTTSEEEATSDPYPSNDAPAYNVTFHTYTSETIEPMFTNVVLEMPFVENPGFTLEGWFYFPDGDVEITFPFYPRNHITIHARWKAAVIEDFTYEETADSNGYIIASYTGSDDEVVIPSAYNNKPIVEIGKEAFMENDTMRKIIIPPTVTNIGEGAFKRATNLIKITLPSNVKNIADEAFFMTIKLEKVIFSTHLETIGNRAFYQTNLYVIEIPAEVKEIKEQAFAQCANLEEIDLRPLTPPVCYPNSLGTNYSRLWITVYDEAYDAYINSEYWQAYASSIGTWGEAR